MTVNKAPAWLCDLCDLRGEASGSIAADGRGHLGSVLEVLRGIRYDEVPRLKAARDLHVLAVPQADRTVLQMD